MANYHNIFTNKLLPLKEPYHTISTTVVSALQIHQIMQNKAKLQKSQVDLSDVLTKDYEKRTLGERGKNKAKQTQPPKRQNGYIPLFKKDLYKFPHYSAYKKQSQTNPT